MTDVAPAGAPRLTMRPLERNDMAELHRVVRAIEVHDRIPIVTTPELLEEELWSGPVVPATDARVAIVDGSVVGYVSTYHLPSDVREERCYVFGGVAPSHRRQGIGTALMRWAMGRATEQLRSSPRSLPRFIRTDRPDQVVGAHALFASLGMQKVRFYEELLRPLTSLPDVVVPDGVRLLPWDDARSDELRAVKNEAFEDHWGSTPTSPEHWRQMTEGPGARRDLSTMAVDNDHRVIALALVRRYPDDDAVLGRSDAWIDKLATTREWRGRGVGTALIAHSLRLFVAEGLTHASIGVDSANPTGAAALYRSLGFEVQERGTTWELSV